MRFLGQSFLLILSFLFVYGWLNTPLGGYTVPALGFLLFLYLIIAARNKRAPIISSENAGTWSIFAINIIVLLLIFATGTFASPLFFLLYFLGFGIAFVFSPTTVFVFAIGIVLIFLQDALKDDAFSNFLRLGSVAIIAPIAFFFGREYSGKDEKKIKK